jgi:hypothetical protein
MVIRLDIEIWIIDKGATKREFGKVVGVSMGEEVWELPGFVALGCVWVHFCCFSGGYLCQALQGAGVVYSWYSRLVSRW